MREEVGVRYGSHGTHTHPSPYYCMPPPCACEGRRRWGMQYGDGCVYGVGGLYYVHVPVRAGGGGGCVMGRGMVLCTVWEGYMHAVCL